MPRRGSRTATSSGSGRRSASRPTSCTRAGRSVSKGSPARSGSSSAPGRYGSRVGTEVGSETTFSDRSVAFPALLDKSSLTLFSHGALSPERSDIIFGVTQLAQDRVGMLAERGNCVHAVRVRVARARRLQRRNLAHGCRDRGPPLARLELRMHPYIVHGVDARISDLRRVEPL